MRYKLPGVPPSVAARGLTAFTPQLTRHAASGAQSYKQAVAGYPGTRGIGVDASQVARADAPSAIAQMGTARSTDAPDMIYPNQYYEAAPWERPGGWPRIKVYDPTDVGATSVLPVPARSFRTTLLRKSSAQTKTPRRHLTADIPSVPRGLFPPWSARG